MSRELRAVAATGTLYARIINSAGLWWNGTEFEAYDESSFGDYDIAMTEQGTSNVYVADFPTAITTGGTYEYFCHKQAGGSPAVGDIVVATGKIDWTGSASVTAASGAMTGSDFYAYVQGSGGFKRTDKSTEFYEAVTDVIQKMRRRFGFEEAGADATTTDTISVLGDFKLSIESDMGLLIGITLQDGVNGYPLEKITKAAFDELYPSINVTSDKGYPQHYCVHNGSIYIGPIPDSVSYTYRLSYSKRAGTITSSTTGVPFTNLYRDVLMDGVLARLYKGLEEYDKSGMHRQDFEDGFLEATRRERKNSGEGTFIMRQADC